jgi:gamma-glutamylaminecyclotransferase
MPALVFVYGTLKEDFPNFSLNSGRRIGGTFRTRLTFPLYVVRLPNEERAPWLVNEPGHGRHVSGQVFEVEPNNLAALDSFEGVDRPDGYVRVEIELEATGGPHTLVRAFAYMKQEHELTRCLSKQGPFEEYTHALAVGYRLTAA